MYKATSLCTQESGYLQIVTDRNDVQFCRVLKQTPQAGPKNFGGAIEAELRQQWCERSGVVNCCEPDGHYRCNSRARILTTRDAASAGMNLCAANRRKVSVTVRRTQRKVAAERSRFVDGTGYRWAFQQARAVGAQMGVGGWNFMGPIGVEK